MNNIAPILKVVSEENECSILNVLLILLKEQDEEDEEDVCVLQPKSE